MTSARISSAQWSRVFPSILHSTIILAADCKLSSIVVCSSSTIPYTIECKSTDWSLQRRNRIHLNVSKTAPNGSELHDLNFNTRVYAAESTTDTFPAEITPIYWRVHAYSFLFNIATRSNEWQTSSRACHATHYPSAGFLFCLFFSPDGIRLLLYLSTHVSNFFCAWFGRARFLTLMICNTSPDDDDTRLEG